MSFRKDFIWGVATAAYQVEGGAFEDGKGRSIWDDYSHTPGMVYHDQTGDVSCDHYHRFREDVALMANLGVKNYRFSIAWSRLLPEGVGAVNEMGVRFYNELIDCLIAHGIRPWVTLFHWDLPSALHRRGGWLNPESPKWFEEYATLVAKRYGDRVKDFFTFNEPQCVIGGGYAEAGMAPGLKQPLHDTIPMSYSIHVAHGLAASKLRELVPGVRIGFVGCGMVGMPASDSTEDIEAARLANFSYPASDPVSWAFSTAWWADPVMLGEYPADALSHYGRYLPRGFEKSLPLIGQPMDFYAHNIYEGVRYRADGKGGTKKLDWEAGHAVTGCDWFVTPEALYWGPKFLYERYHKPIFITENGMSTHDAISLDGKVHDPNRVDYLHRYLRELRRAATDGADVFGYMEWSFLDNFEWSRGYKERFGLVYVDYATGKRIPKDSAEWYRRVMELNGEAL